MTNMMRNKGVTRIALVAAILVTVSGCAAISGQSGDYYFGAVGRPSGDTLTVHFVNMATGQPVTDARLFALRTEHRAAKATPSVVYQHVPLNPDGHGDYIYEGRDVQAGALIPVAAQLPGHDSLIWGIVRVPD